MRRKDALATQSRVLRLILVIRRQRVIVDSDLALLYGVSTGALVQAVKRNRSRFPADFMFQLSRSEFAALRSQNVISNSRGGRRTAPYVFTEQGVAMLSTVLRSPRAIAVNIQIMRTFVHLRRMAAEHADLAARLDELEERYDTHFKVVFDAIRSLIAPPAVPKKRVGYLTAASA
jgi:hypothetical protein